MAAELVIIDGVSQLPDETNLDAHIGRDAGTLLGHELLRCGEAAVGRRPLGRHRREQGSTGSGSDRM